MAILVTGGAGYIGSHTVAELLERGQDVVVLDDLRTGHLEAVLTPRFYRGPVADRALLDRVFSDQRIDSVIHFAAASIVPESVTDPLAYYENNVLAAQRLFAAMRDHGVRHVVFSSTAAAYGEPTRIPMHEDDPTLPTNPYGETKLAIERMLKWCDRAYGIRSVSLRYFNAAGAHPKRPLGEDHANETHLIPLVLRTALGLRDSLSVFGDDYPTEDGTCIRDYVHVMDLASAHLQALTWLENGGKTEVFNLGCGAGYSVQQVVDKARAITACAIPVEIAPRRPGDPAILIASSERARAELGWTPRHENLDDIISTAWQWHRSHPHGYESLARRVR